MSSFEQSALQGGVNVLPEIQRIQIKLAQKSPEKLRKWAGNQGNLNEAVKKVLDHFVDVYGEEDINSLEVKLKMAKDLVTVQGKEHDPVKLPEKVVIPKEPVKKTAEKKKIINRGDIDI